jgi:hypothetical protein
MTKDTVRALHKDIDKVLDGVAKAHGFLYTPGGLRYSEIDITGRMKFILKGKEAQAMNSRSVDGFKVGAKVKVPTHPQYGTFTVESISNRGSLHVTRDRDGKRFRLKPGQAVAADGSPAPNAMECPDCKKMTMTSTSQVVGPECVKVTYRCPCGYKDVDVAD